MKSTNCLSLLLVITLKLASCVPAGSETIPTQVETPVSSPTHIAPTVTSTLPPTLEPEQAKETIRVLLQEPVDCAAPCFWGIVPGQTTVEEAANTFIHLGLGLKFTTTFDGKDFYGVNYNLHDGIEVSPIIGIQNNIVKSLDIGINDTSPEGTPRKWTAYSPETLISRYGAPSTVDFFLGRVAPNPMHAMVLYFEKADLIMRYGGRDFLNNKKTLELCPLLNKVDYIEIWMGDDPLYPPSPDVPLEEATSLTMEEFSNLMTGDPKMACFNLKEEAFPQ